VAPTFSAANMEIKKNIGVIAAWRYDSAFSEIREKLIDDVFLELYINEKFQDSILTIDDNLRLLSIGHFFLSLQIYPEHIVNNITLNGYKSKLVLAENIIEKYYKKLCYKRVCSCSAYRSLEAESICLPKNELAIKANIVANIFGDFQDSSDLFKETGGVHGVGLYTAGGEKAAFFKDISRHNCISKAVGFLIESNSKKTIAEPLLMMVSCRVNEEIIQMAGRAGIKILITRAAPSLSAYREAQRSGMTLIGFVREGRFTIFAGEKRIRN
jgi:formate dehydrogenase accessory protein FdhD